MRDLTRGIVWFALGMVAIHFAGRAESIPLAYIAGVATAFGVTFLAIHFATHPRGGRGDE